MEPRGWRAACFHLTDEEAGQAAPALVMEAELEPGLLPPRVTLSYWAVTSPSHSLGGLFSLSEIQLTRNPLSALCSSSEWCLHLALAFTDVVLVNQGLRLGSEDSPQGSPSANHL